MSHYRLLWLCSVPKGPLKKYFLGKVHQNEKLGKKEYNGNFNEVYAWNTFIRMHNLYLLSISSFSSCDAGEEIYDV